MPSPDIVQNTPFDIETCSSCHHNAQKGDTTLSLAKFIFLGLCLTFFFVMILDTIMSVFYKAVSS
jgi:hypothetical protein